MKDNELCGVTIGGINMMIDIKNGAISISEQESLEDESAEDTEDDDIGSENEYEDEDITKEDTDMKDKETEETEHKTLTTEEFNELLREYPTDADIDPEFAERCRKILEEDYAVKMGMIEDVGVDNVGEEYVDNTEYVQKNKNKALSMLTEAKQEKDVQLDEKMAEILNKKIDILNKKFKNGLISKSDAENIRGNINEALKGIERRKEIRDEVEKKDDVFKQIVELHKKGITSLDEINAALEQSSKEEEKKDTENEVKSEKVEGKNERKAEDSVITKDVEEKWENLGEEKSEFSKEVSIGEKSRVHEVKNEVTKSIPEKKNRQKENKSSNSSNYIKSEKIVQTKNKVEYDKLEIGELSRIVKERMIELGARYKMIDKETMINEFGVSVIRQLMKNGTIVSKNDKFTIGI